MPTATGSKGKGTVTAVQANVHNLTIKEEASEEYRDVRSFVVQVANMTPLVDMADMGPLVNMADIGMIGIMGNIGMNGEMGMVGGLAVMGEAEIRMMNEMAAQGRAIGASFGAMASMGSSLGCSRTFSRCRFSGSGTYPRRSKTCCECSSTCCRT